MSEGKRCPACGENIGVWAVFSAVVPSRIRCSHCRTRLRYRISLDVVVIFVFAIPVIALASYSLANFFAPIPSDAESRQLPTRRGWTLIFLGVALVVGLLMELAITWYLRTMKRLECYRPSLRNKESTK